MDVIWQMALSNAALVAAGTPIVWLIGRFGRWPAITHGLAVILLLKLITPPLWRIPISWPHETPKISAELTETRSLTNNEQPFIADSLSPRAFTPVQHSSGISRRASPAASDLSLVASAPTVPPSTTSVAHPISSARFDWEQFFDRAVPIAGWIWAGGSALCVLIAGRRIFHFSRALRFAIPARGVQPRACMLARRLGLRRCPDVWFVPASIAPMLWSLGHRPRLLLPRDLWERLGVAERDTILLHELAHFRRGDNFVRWIEVTATCLYWWHPACWWACWELREAEEQCCDAWVLWAMPGVFRNYANALLEAVEFASIGADRPSARRAVPALASRMGQFAHLRRRLTMLKHGNIARALSWGGLAGVMTLGSIMLPVGPTWGQDQPNQTPAAAARDGDASANNSQPATNSSDAYIRGKLDQIRLNQDQAKLQAAIRDENAAIKRFYDNPAGAAPQLQAVDAKSDPLDGSRAAGPNLPTTPADPMADDPRQNDPAAELARARRTIVDLQRQLLIAEARLKELEFRQATGAPPSANQFQGTPNNPFGGKTGSGVSSSSWGNTVTTSDKAAWRINTNSNETTRVAPTPAENSPAGGSSVPNSGVSVGRPGNTAYREVIGRRPDGTGSTAFAPPAVDDKNSESERLDRIEAQLRLLMSEIDRMRQVAHQLHFPPTEKRRRRTLPIYRRRRLCRSRNGNELEA